MAELFLARTKDTEGFEELVVVKRILPQFLENAAFLTMFLTEARLAAQLHHPNIAQVYDVGVEHGDYFFSMEYVHGEDLGRIIAAAGENGVPLSLDAALTLAAGLCAGLHHAHEKADATGRPLGIVHRDVSPPNVLVSYDGAVKLVDFGIARATTTTTTTTKTTTTTTTTKTTTGGLEGKLAFMSPEQCRGQPLDRRSDLYAVGTILYEMTTGQLPFAGQSASNLLNCIVHSDVPPPSSLVADYPEALEAIVMRALARDPAQRFASARQLQVALEAYAHDSRLRVSPLVLARLMSTLFPARLEEWERARAAGAFFVEQHVVRTLIESGKTGDLSPLAVAAAAAAATAALAEAPEPEEQRDPTSVTQPLDLGVTAEIAVASADQPPARTSIYSAVAPPPRGPDLEDALIAPPLPAPYVPPVGRRLPTPPVGMANLERPSGSLSPPSTAPNPANPANPATAASPATAMSAIRRPSDEHQAHDITDVPGVLAVSAAELAVGDSTELVRPLDHRMPSRRAPRRRTGLLVGVSAVVIALGVVAAVATAGRHTPMTPPSPPVAMPRAAAPTVAPITEPIAEPSAEPIAEPIPTAPAVVAPAPPAVGAVAPPPVAIDIDPPPPRGPVTSPPHPAVIAPAHTIPHPVVVPTKPHPRPEPRPVHPPRPNDGKGSAWTEDSPFMPVRSDR